MSDWTPERETAARARVARETLDVAVPPVEPESIFVRQSSLDLRDVLTELDRVRAERRELAAALERAEALARSGSRGAATLDAIADLAARAREGKPRSVTLKTWALRALPAGHFVQDLVVGVGPAGQISLIADGPVVSQFVVRAPNSRRTSCR